MPTTQSSEHMESFHNYGIMSLVIVLPGWLERWFMQDLSKFTRSLNWKSGDQSFTSSPTHGTETIFYPAIMYSTSPKAMMMYFAGY